jgi:hypothetical protein
LRRSIGAAFTSDRRWATSSLLFEPLPLVLQAADWGELIRRFGFVASVTVRGVSSTVAQARRYAVNGEVDAVHDRVAGFSATVALQ